MSSKRSNSNSNSNDKQRNTVIGMEQRPSLLSSDDDDEDSDEEFLRRYVGRPTFGSSTSGSSNRHSSSKERVPAAAPLTQSSVETTNTSPDQSPSAAAAAATTTTMAAATFPAGPSSNARGGVPKRRILSAEQIERKAQAFVQELNLGIVKNVWDMTKVGWRTRTIAYTKKKSKSNKRSSDGNAKNNNNTNSNNNNNNNSKEYFPCIRLSDDESRLLFEKGLGKNKCGVRYLGFHSKHALQWEQIVPTAFYSLHRSNDSDKNDDDDDKNDFNLLPLTDEECLTLYLNQEFGEEPSVEKRVEELIIQRSWDKVRENKIAKDAEQRTEAEHIAQIAAQVKQWNQSKGKADDDNNDNPTTTPLTPRRGETTTAQDYDSDSDDADVDNDDDDEDETEVFSPESKRKKIRLRPGDVLQYYLPNRVFGCADALTESVIVGIDARAHNFPLNLESGDFIDRDSKVRRLARKFKGALIEEPDSTFINVSEYELRTAGNMNLVAFQQRVDNIKQTRQSHAQSMDDFWQRGAAGSDGGAATAAAASDGGPTTSQTVEGEEETTKAADQQEKGKDKKGKGKKRNKPGNDSPATGSSPKDDPRPNWHKRLLSLLEETEEKMKKKRRYNPRITPAEFQLILQVLTLLQDRIGKCRMPMELDDEVVQILLGELDDPQMSTLRLEAILSGDPHHKLSERNKLEIVESLKGWVEKQPQPQPQIQPQHDDQQQPQEPATNPATAPTAQAE